jgi:hypothetical protein
MGITFHPDQSYPTNNENQFPIGQEIVLVFNKPLDLKAAKESVILYGPDSDKTSGPDNGLWLNRSDGTNPFFLNSPGFKGFVECEFESFLVNNLEELKVIDSQKLISKVEVDSFTVLVVTPKNPLKINTSYNLFICGENLDNLENVPAELAAYSQSNCISERTVFDAYYFDGLQKSESKRLRSKGSFEPLSGENEAKLNIKIVTPGNGSSAKYVWWFDGEEEPNNPAHSLWNSRLSRCVQRWRVTSKGVLIKFELAEYEVGERFKVDCHGKELLEQSFTIQFNTGTDSIFEYPEHSSTSPIAPGGLLLPDSIGAPAEERVEVLSMNPADGEVNVRLDLNKIFIKFNKEIDPASVTQESVTLESHSVSGVFDGSGGTRSNRPQKVFKIISVSGDTITLEI